FLHMPQIDRTMTTTIATRANWIFDMDGTLTPAVHDFDAIRVDLGLPAGRPILESLRALPERESRPLFVRLEAIELEIARASHPAEGAHALLAELRARGARLGIVTRNNMVNVRATLAAAGLAEFFEERDVVCRDRAAPKPSPAGIGLLL